MLRVNVGLSRKVSRDYQSTGYTVNLDGEIAAPQEDQEAVLQAIDHLYRLAEDALSREIDRDQGEDAIGRRDQDKPANGSRNGNGNGRNAAPPAQESRSQPSADGNSRSSRDEPATNKQIQYLQSIGKRQRLSTPQLEARIEEVLGQRVGIYHLTKKEAGAVIDSLTQEAQTNGHR